MKRSDKTVLLQEKSVAYEVWARRVTSTANDVDHIVMRADITLRFGPQSLFFVLVHERFYGVWKPLRFKQVRVQRKQCITVLMLEDRNIYFLKSVRYCCAITKSDRLITGSKERSIVIRKSIIFICFFIFTQQASAELFGLANGGLVVSQDQSGLGLEAAYSLGEIESIDYSHLGLRASYPLRQNLKLFADLGNSNTRGDDNINFGIGGLLRLDAAANISDAIDSAFLKTSLHSVSYVDCNSGTTFNPGTALTPTPSLDGDFIDITGGVTVTSSCSDTRGFTAVAEGLVSGNVSHLISNAPENISWYANAGIHTFGDLGIDATVGFGAGLAFPISAGTFYVALDNVESFVFSLGFQQSLDFLKK